MLKKLLTATLLAGALVAPASAQSTAITQPFFGMAINRAGTSYATPNLLGQCAPSGTAFTCPVALGNGFGSYISIDSFGTHWSDIMTASGTIPSGNWSSLDTRVAALSALGVDMVYPIYETPVFISSNPTASCATASLGGCYPPTDVNSDGTGTDATLISFLTQLLGRYGAQIAYYEVWNEANITTEWAGTNAQLVRMAADARSTILALNPNAKFLSPSFTDLLLTSAATTMATYLTTAVSGYGTGGAAADIIDFHGYVYIPSSYPVPLAENQVANVANLQAALLAAGDTADLAKPLWDTEWGGSGQITDPDMLAAFVARHMLIEAGQNIPRTYYFDWSISDNRALWTTTAGLAANCLGAGTATSSGPAGYLCQSGTAYQQTQSWLLGATVSVPCAGPAPPATGVWTCGITLANGLQALAVWNTAQSCASGSCTTSSYSYGAGFVEYYGKTASGIDPGATTLLSGGTVPIGAKPILLVAATAYYVDCVNGVDKSNNPGTSPGSAWKTLARVNGYVNGVIYSGNTTLTDTGFNPGDSLFLRRGCTWDWHLAFNPYSAGPPASGNFNGTGGSGPAVFTVDAFGNGAPPTIQGEIPVNLNYVGLEIPPAPAPAPAMGATKITFVASSLSGIMLSGSTFNIAGDTHTYTVTNNVTAIGNALSGVTFTPALYQAEAQGAAVTPNSWTHLSGNIYYAPVTSTSQGTGFNPSNVSMVKAAGVWGQCRGQQVAGSPTPYCFGSAGTADLALGSTANQNGDWYYSSSASGQGCTSNCGTIGNLYVYDSIGSNPTVDLGAIVAILDGGIQLFSINGISYITVQHVKLLNASWYGLEVSGASDNLIFANVHANSEVPFNFHGTGFYLHPSSASSNIQLLNVDSHRGYYGFQFAGAITAVTLSNCKAYFNRAAGLADLTASGLSVAYDHCHFYGNGIGSPTPNDIAINATLGAPGGVAGAGNIAPNTDPHVTSWQNYTPRFALNYRGPGAAYGSDVALNAQLSALGTAPLSIGIATNYTYSTSLISQFNTWLADGYDLNSMGLSSASYANANAINIWYIGTCSTTSLTITGTPATSLSVAASGGTCPAGDSFTIPITATTTMSALKATLLANTDYTVSWPQPCGSCSWVDGSAMLAQDIAANGGTYVGPSYTGHPGPYSINLNQDQFLKDETALSQAWIKSNLTGWGSTWVYLYPGTLFNPTSAGLTTIEQDVAGSGSPVYTGSVGSTSMQIGRDGLSGAFDAVAANGVDALGLVTYSLSGWANLTPTALQAAVQAAVEKASVWGVPQTLYWQAGGLSNSQLTLIVADLRASGATLMTNSSLVSFLGTSPRVQVATLPLSSGNCSCWAWTPEIGTLSLSPTYLSPTVGAGNTLSSSYQYDLNGILQPQTWSAVNAKTSATVSKAGWDIGSQALVPSLTGGLRPGH